MLSSEGGETLGGGIKKKKKSKKNKAVGGTDDGDDKTTSGITQPAYEKEFEFEEKRRAVRSGLISWHTVAPLESAHRSLPLARALPASPVLPWLCCPSRLLVSRFLPPHRLLALPVTTSTLLDRMQRPTCFRVFPSPLESCALCLAAAASDIFLRLHLRQDPKVKNTPWGSSYRAAPEILHGADPDLLPFTLLGSLGWCRPVGGTSRG